MNFVNIAVVNMGLHAGADHRNPGHGTTSSDQLILDF